MMDQTDDLLYCRACKFDTISKQELELHILAEHPAIFYCAHCGGETGHVGDCPIAMALDMMVKGKPCPSCGATELSAHKQDCPLWFYGQREKKTKKKMASAGATTEITAEATVIKATPEVIRKNTAKRCADAIRAFRYPPDIIATLSLEQILHDAAGQIDEMFELDPPATEKGVCLKCKGEGTVVSNQDGYPPENITCDSCDGLRVVDVLPGTLIKAQRNWWKKDDA